MSICPCCSNNLLRHWKNKQTYWYCCSCRQEMPNLEPVRAHQRQQQVIFPQDLITQLSERSKLSFSSVSK